MLENETILQLGSIGYELYMSCLVGNSPPSVQRRFERMQQLRDGDLVIETSTAGWWRCNKEPPKDRPHVQAQYAVGYFEREAQEPVPDWDEEENGEPAPMERVFYIKLLNGQGDLFRWVNANFITILPTEGWPR